MFPNSHRSVQRGFFVTKYRQFRVLTFHRIASPSVRHRLVLLYIVYTHFITRVRNSAGQRILVFAVLASRASYAANASKRV